MKGSDCGWHVVRRALHRWRWCRPPAHPPIPSSLPPCRPAAFPLGDLGMSALSSAVVISLDLIGSELIDLRSTSTNCRNDFEKEKKKEKGRNAIFGRNDALDAVEFNSGCKAKPETDPRQSRLTFAYHLHIICISFAYHLHNRHLQRCLIVNAS